MTLLAGLVALSAALAPPADSAPNGHVRGVIRSSALGSPVAYANIEVVGRGVSDWTDQNGEYALDAVPEGRWKVRVIHPNHDSLTLEIVVPGGRSLALDLTLQARPGPVVDALGDFEPFQVEYVLPALLNSVEVKTLIQQRYPSHLLGTGAAGEAVLRLWLDERGQVVRGLVSRSSGYAALDSVAEWVADRMKFRPAKSRDQPVRVIVQIPVMFTTPPPRPDPAG